MRHGLLVAATLALAACGGGSKAPSGPPPAPIPFTRPVVTLSDVKMDGVGITGGSVLIVMRVYNPNDYGLEQPRVTYNLYLDDSKLTDGMYDADITIAPGDTAFVQVPASVSYVKAGLAGKSLVNMGSVNWRVIGNIYADTPYGRLGSPYDRVGRFSTVGTVKKKIQ
jgi:LEA14-like dessication related protein